ncbi:NmrA/HSCARG family protein [Roseomonas sp. NAR14]|uniref:NmrA/HSCARG family protein n=1 Tax=Roseomonas acroporae TaxID=2937791 RepID=A0A9X1YI78_9PROT|nr:NmrA/HSCARG family protein [Roseomonas acroporae]MCK8786661.1 NmrA/HSCARG family protein [Roseomonas acroporae]
MTILVTGSTGTIGGRIVKILADSGASVRALARKPEEAEFPPGVTPVKGDLLDVPAMRAALSGVDTLFLLNAVVPDELTQALVTLSLAREAGIRRFVYFSVLRAEHFTDVPHFTGKYTVERMIGQLDLPATVLRPAYFMQNDASMKEAILHGGVYPMPVGGVGVQMVDAGDIAATAAHALLRRERSADPLPREVIEVAGPEPLTGEGIAAIWSAALGRPVRYGGDDLDAFEQASAKRSPGWMAYDMRCMVRRFQQDGMLPAPGGVERLAALLGRAPRDYRDFAAEMAARWRG